MLLAIVGLATLLQLAFFWYYVRRGQGNDSIYPKLPGDSGDNTARASANVPAQAPGGGSPEGEDTVVRCETCGFENRWDPVYTYCGRCVSKLG